MDKGYILELEECEYGQENQERITMSANSTEMASPEALGEAITLDPLS